MLIQIKQKHSSALVILPMVLLLSILSSTLSSFSFGAPLTASQFLRYLDRLPAPTSQTQAAQTNQIRRVFLENLATGDSATVELVREYWNHYLSESTGTEPRGGPMSVHQELAALAEFRTISWHSPAVRIMGHIDGIPLGSDEQADGRRLDAEAHQMAMERALILIDRSTAADLQVENIEDAYSLQRHFFSAAHSQQILGNPTSSSNQVRFWLGLAGKGSTELNSAVETQLLQWINDSSAGSSERRIQILRKVKFGRLAEAALVAQREQHEELRQGPRAAQALSISTLRALFDGQNAAGVQAIFSAHAESIISFLRLDLGLVGPYPGAIDAVEETAAYLSATLRRAGVRDLSQTLSGSGFNGTAADRSGLLLGETSVAPLSSTARHIATLLYSAEPTHRAVTGYLKSLITMGFVDDPSGDWSQMALSSPPETRAPYARVAALFIGEALGERTETLGANPGVSREIQELIRLTIELVPANMVFPPHGLAPLAFLKGIVSGRGPRTAEEIRLFLVDQLTRRLRRHEAGPQATGYILTALTDTFHETRLLEDEILASLQVSVNLDHRIGATLLSEGGVARLARRVTSGSREMAFREQCLAALAHLGLRTGLTPETQRFLVDLLTEVRSVRRGQRRLARLSMREGVAQALLASARVRPLEQNVRLALNLHLAEYARGYIPDYRLLDQAGRARARVSITRPGGPYRTAGPHQYDLVPTTAEERVFQNLLDAIQPALENTFTSPEANAAPTHQAIAVPEDQAVTETAHRAEFTHAEPTPLYGVRISTDDPASPPRDSSPEDNNLEYETSIRCRDALLPVLRRESRRR